MKRLVTIGTLLVLYLRFAGGDLLDPYDTAIGQVILLLPIGLWFGCVMWLHALCRYNTPVRYRIARSEGVRVVNPLQVGATAAVLVAAGLWCMARGVRHAPRSLAAAHHAMFGEPAHTERVGRFVDRHARRRSTRPPCRAALRRRPHGGCAHAGGGGDEGADLGRHPARQHARGHHHAHGDGAVAVVTRVAGGPRDRSHDGSPHRRPGRPRRRSSTVAVSCAARRTTSCNSWPWASPPIRASRKRCASPLVSAPAPRSTRYARSCSPPHSGASRCGRRARLLRAPLRTCRELCEFATSLERQGLQGVSIGETVATLQHQRCATRHSTNWNQREADHANTNLSGPTIGFVVSTIVFLAYPLAQRISDAFGGWADRAPL